MQRLIFLLLLMSLPAFARSPDVRVQIIDGKSYVCFGRLEARDLLQMRINLPKLQLKLKKLNELLDISDQKSKLFLDMQKNLIDRNEVYTKQIASLQDQLDQAHSFWRSPILWFVIGAVVGTTATIAVVEAVK